MSECIICKGKKPKDIGREFTFCKMNEFEAAIAPYIWGDSSAWTIKVSGLSIDYYLTKAQEDINRGIAYEDTVFYDIICKLIDKNVKLAMWYDIYYEELPTYHELEDILAVCYKGITDISGMCEVYFKME